MLSRTANNLFWLSRYIERAEFVARILDVTQRLSALPSAYAGAGNEWEAALNTAGNAELFFAQNERVTPQSVTEFLIFSPDNPSSIANCLNTARVNARGIRTALTVEMWEAINEAWLAFKKFRPQNLGREDFSRLVAFVGETSLRFDGSAYRTMLRNDAYWFSRVGVMIERADNTARILDVKYHVLLPEQEKIGGSLDYFQWTAVLRAVSAVTSYHWVYKENIKPWLVADLLLLNDQMPRSLAACYESITRNLDLLAVAYGRQGAAQRVARQTRSKLENAEIETIFRDGLHEFVTDFIGDNNRLGAAIAEQYLI